MFVPDKIRYCLFTCLLLKAGKILLPDVLTGGLFCLELHVTHTWLLLLLQIFPNVRFTQQDKQDAPLRNITPARYRWTRLVFAPVSRCLRRVMHQISKSFFCNWVKVEALTCPKQSRGQILHNMMTLPPSCHGSVLQCRTRGPPPVSPAPHWAGPACTNTGSSLQAEQTAWA